MLEHVEVVQSNEHPGEWIVEGQTSDGGIRRAIFIDADAQSRAEAYAEFIEFLRQQNQRTSEALSA